MSTTPPADLIEAIHNGNALFVVGAGATLAAVGGPTKAPTASWRGLIEDGLVTAQRYHHLPDSWLVRERGKLEEAFARGDLVDILEVASTVETRLGAPEGGEWAKWLRRTIGELKVADTRVPTALLTLAQNCLLTTNYDDALTTVPGKGLRPIPWTDSRKVARVLRKEDRGVVHLHGHWDTPGSVVLGMKSYDAVVKDDHAQAMQQAAAALGTLVFVGFGGGLEDPNFGPLLNWMSSFWKDEHQHFRLCLKDEMTSLIAKHPPTQRVQLVPYGDSYEDLAPFLESLTTAASIQLGSPNPSAVPEGWADVDFAEQRDLSAALRGESLGPKDADACPKLPEVDELVRAFRNRHVVALVGESGDGKSITAFHVAQLMHREGRSVVRLIDPALGVPSVTQAPKHIPRLLLVDNAHQYNRQSIDALCNIASEHTKLLLVGTQSIEGRVYPLHTNANRAVKLLASEFTTRASELEHLVHAIDKEVGPRYFDTPIERVLDDAARSKSPWQYMFVLGRGHRRCRTIVEALSRANEADIALLAISIGQIATRDRGITKIDLIDLAKKHGRSHSWVDRSLQATREQGVLVEEGDLLLTPHPRVAQVVLQLALPSRWQLPAIQEYVRKTLVDRSLPLPGRSWLLRELSFGEVRVGRSALSQGVREALWEEMKPPLSQGDEALAAAAWLTHSLMMDSETNSVICAIPEWLIEQIHAGGPKSGYALAGIVNDVYNGDKDAAKALVERVSASTMAGKISNAGADDLDSIGYLVDRLLIGSTPGWREDFFSSLDFDGLEARWRSLLMNRLFSVCHFAGHLVWHNDVLAQKVALAILPLAKAAFEADVLDAWIQVRDLVYLGLGFLPLATERPSGFPLEFATKLAEQVEPRKLAESLSVSRMREWEPLANLCSWINEVAPQICMQAAPFVNTTTLATQARPLFAEMSREVEMLFYMLFLDNLEPGASLLRSHVDTLRVLPCHLASEIPDVTAQVVDAGGTVRWGLGGGLPHWERAAHYLEKLESFQAGLAAKCLSPAASQIADGLLLKQENSGEGIEAFLKAASLLAPTVLSEALQQIDAGRATETWSARLGGPEKSRDAVMHLLGTVASVRGPAKDLAACLLVDARSTATDSVGGGVKGASVLTGAGQGDELEPATLREGPGAGTVAKANIGAEAEERERAVDAELEGEIREGGSWQEK